MALTLGFNFAANDQNHTRETPHQLFHRPLAVQKSLCSLKMLSSQGQIFWPLHGVIYRELKS